MLSVIAASSTKYGGACLTQAIRTMMFQDNPKPNNPGEKASTLLKKKCNRACKKWVKIEEEAEDNTKLAFELILKHCNPSMKMKLELTTDFQQIKYKQDSMDF